MLEPTTQQGILARLDDASRIRLVDEMEPDDRARLIARLPEGEGAPLLKRMDPDEREMTERLLGYPDESAGRIMTPEFVPLRPDMTVSEALNAVREGERSAETIHFMPVIDEDGRLVGTIGLPDLVLADPQETVGDLATRDVPAIRVDEDQEDVARLMKEADLMAVPVVDEHDTLVGIITFDDAMEVLDFEETEDIALIVSTTMVAVCALGALVGAMMPLVARLVSVDPAVFSAPFVTTIVDASGLLIYFFIARAVLNL